MKLLRSCVSIFICIAILLPSAPVRAMTPGGGLITYGQTSSNNPKLRMYRGSSNSWTNAVNLPTLNAVPNQTIIRASPTSSEMIAGYAMADGTLVIYKWNGFTWAQQWTTSTGIGAITRFDIAYEQVSGEAVVMYGRNTNAIGQLGYRIWQPSTGMWVNENAYTTLRTTGTINNVRMASQAGTNAIAVAWGDSNLDLSANYWDGANNLLLTEPLTAASTGLAVIGTSLSLNSNSFDIAIEQISGDVLLTWGNNGTADLIFITRSAGTAGTWGTSATNTAFNTEPTDLTVRSDPKSDYIGLVNSFDNTLANNAEAIVWTGTAWGTTFNVDTSADTVGAGTRNSSIEWVTSGTNTRAVVTYDDNNAAGIDWAVYNKNANSWAVQTDYTTAPAPAALNDIQHLLIRNSDGTKLMSIIVDENRDMFVKQLTLSGTTLSWATVEPGGVAMELNVPTAGGWNAAFDYSKSITAASLAADMVDANDNSIANPSINFSAIVASPSCQTTTATLGTSTQEVRIKNFTATPGWTTSIAATGGKNSVWTSSLNTFDYNDPSGSPAGCTDGSDSDQVAGQLKINPSNATIIPDILCSSTGLSKGSSSAFNDSIVDSITLISATSSAEPDCFWDIMDIGLSQNIPDQVSAGSYTLNLTITTVAN